MPSQYRFSIPSLPKPIWEKFQEIRKANHLTQKQCIMLGVMAICFLGVMNPQHIEDLVKKVLEEDTKD